jgi:hypothetical protein
MSYSQKYYFTFYSDRDTRIVDGLPDEYLCSISQLDYAGASTEIQAQQNPIQINYQNTSSNKLEPIIGSECTLNLIATEDFELEDLYSENEREFMVQIYRKETPNTLIINWELEEDISGVDANLEILVNGVQIVNQFNSASGSFNINLGDTVLIKSFSYTSTSGNNGVNLEITGIPTKRSVIFPFAMDTTIIPTTDINVFLQSTHSATEYTAIRSAVFETSCASGEGSLEVFTKNYNSVTSQAAAQALADADSGFTAEGQAYANANGVCYVSPGEFEDLIWQGFIIPDGCQESFTFPPYVISVNAVDGIGLLKNLSYVQNDGNFYLGKQTFIEVIQACLVRLEAPALYLNTCVNIFEDSMTQGDTYDPLDQCYVNSERFLKDDQFNPMSCEEVLRSVLELWTAVLVQSSGEWFIYRPTELAVDGSLTFRRYLDGYRVYDQSTLTENLDLVLGGESEGVIAAPYFHINTDQIKMIDRPYKNASMSFLYGFVTSLIVNPEFVGWNGITFTDWAKSNVLLPLTEDSAGGAKLGNVTASPGPYEYIENITPAPITEGDMVVFKMSYYNYISDGPSARVMLTDGLTTWYLDQTGEWGVNDTRINGLTLQYYEGAMSITARRAPITGNLTIRLYEAREDLIPPSIDLFITYRSASIIPNIGTEDPIGEMHTATQTGKFTFVPETVNLFNGDTTSNLYLSGIYQANQTTLTTLWNRRGISESILATPYESSKPFLRIAVEEKQRLYAGPFVRFEGSIFGYFNPLQRWSINLIEGYFMNLSLTYDLQQNICKAVLGRIVDDEIALDYTLTPDYGATTKVTVKAGP